jgi:four helix bundle protein
MQRAEVRSYRDLFAWQKAMDLVVAVYDATASFPREEVFGLTSPIRRAVVSVPSNMAEGQGRKSRKEFLHHLSIAYGSLCELETQLLLAERLGYLPPSRAHQLLELSAEVGRLANGLMSSLTPAPASVPLSIGKPLTTDH